MSRRREQLIPEEDWQRAIRHDLDRLREANISAAAPLIRHIATMDPVTVASMVAHFRPRYVQGAHTAEWVDISYVSDVPDQSALDPTPDRCWRCDASPSTDDLGLCHPCKASLTRGTA